MFRRRDHEDYIGSYDPEYEMPDPDRRPGQQFQSDRYRDNARDSRFGYRFGDRKPERNAGPRGGTQLRGDRFGGSYDSEERTRIQGRESRPQPGRWESVPGDRGFEFDRYERRPPFEPPGGSAGYDRYARGEEEWRSRERQPGGGYSDRSGGDYGRNRYDVGGRDNYGRPGYGSGYENRADYGDARGRDLDHEVNRDRMRRMREEEQGGARWRDWDLDPNDRDRGRGRW
jgi:hypothetical protein